MHKLLTCLGFAAFAIAASPSFADEMMMKNGQMMMMMPDGKTMMMTPSGDHMKMAEDAMMKHGTEMKGPMIMMMHDGHMMMMNDMKMDNGMMMSDEMMKK